MWWVICQGFREGWHYHDFAAENLNVSWIEEATPETRTVELDLKNAIGTDLHPFLRLRDNRSTFLAPEGTILCIRRDEIQRTSMLELSNDFAKVSFSLEWQGWGPALVTGSAWAPRGRGISQVAYRLVIKVSYLWRSKIPFSKKSLEHMAWAERMVDYVISKVSFRSFEDEKNRSWRDKEIESIENLLRIRRWD